MLRTRGAEAARDAGLDDGAFLPQTRTQVTRPPQSGALCLAGHRVPSPDGAVVVCPTCGRPAAARPTSDGRMGA